MSEWKEYKLGEVVTFQRGFDLPKDKMQNGDYPVAGSNGVIGWHNEYTTKGPGVTIGRSGNIGISHYYKSNYWAHNTSLFVKDFKGNNPLFIYYFLKTIDFTLLNTGSAVPTLNRNHVHELNVSVPPIEEQRQIAGVLSSLDDKIDLLNRENATLEALAETLFRHYFIENTNPDWAEGKLGDVVKIGIGRTPPRKETKWFSTSSMDVKWISIKDMGETGVYIFNTAEYLTREAVDCFKIPIIPSNTVVLSFKMTVGRVGITSEDMLSNEAIAHFILDDNSLISREYLYIFLKLFKFDTLGSTSSIVTSINSAMIKDMELIIPDKDSMMLFNKQVCPLFEKIKTNQQQIISLSAQRDTLLPKLMSNELTL